MGRTPARPWRRRNCQRPQWFCPSEEGRKVGNQSKQQTPSPTPPSPLQQHSPPNSTGNTPHSPIPHSLMLNWGAGLVRLLAQQNNVQMVSGASAALAQATCPAAVTAAAVVIQQHSAEGGAWQHLFHLQQHQHMHTSACCEAAGSLSQHVVQLDRLRPAAGSTKLVRSRQVACCPNLQLPLCQFTPRIHKISVFAPLAVQTLGPW